MSDQRGRRKRQDPATTAALDAAIRTSLNVLDHAGDAQLDRLIDQLRKAPAKPADGQPTN